VQSKGNSRKDLIKAAVFLLIGLVTLGLLIVALGGVRFWEELDNYVIRFDTVKDLGVGRPVKFQGISAGRVLEVGIDPDNPAKIRVLIGIREELALYQGTTASISQKGLVGDNYVFLQLRGEPGPKLEPGAEIPAQPSADMNAVVAKIGNVLEDLGPRLTSIAKGIEGFVSEENSENMQRFMAKAPEVMENIDRAVKELGPLIADARSTMSGMEEDWSKVSDAAVEGISQGRESMDRLSEDLGDTLARIEAAVSDVSGNLNRTMDVVRSRVDETGGSISEFAQALQDDWEYDQERLEMVLINLEELTEELKLFSRSLRERPWQIIHTPEQGMHE
jgi:phospholipid/cholesterol/gamma-HCH transport system substrate-binding protein